MSLPTFALIMTFSTVKTRTKTFLEATTSFTSPNWNIPLVHKYSTHFLLDSDNIFAYLSNLTLPTTVLVQPMLKTTIPKVFPSNHNNE